MANEWTLVWSTGLRVLRQKINPQNTKLATQNLCPQIRNPQSKTCPRLRLVPDSERGSGSQNWNTVLRSLPTTKQKTSSSTPSSPPLFREVLVLILSIL